MRPRHRKSSRGKIAAIAVILVIVVSIVAAYRLTSGTPAPPASDLGRTRILMETSMGNFTIQLFGDMPITAGNFKNLVSEHAYDGTVFGLILSGNKVQGGDVSKTYGDVSAIEDEPNKDHHNTVGMVAMAKVELPTVIPNSATSQFFINLKDNSEAYDAKFSVFGQVTLGMEVVQNMGMLPPTAEKPVLISATIIQ